MTNSQDSSLQDQIAVVTGAGRGIGAAISKKLAGMGARIVLCGRTRKPLVTTAEEISREGGSSEVVECDVTNLKAVETLAKHVDATHGRIDILVNNAGIGGFGGPLHEMAPQAWETVLNQDLPGIFFFHPFFCPNNDPPKKRSNNYIFPPSWKNPPPEWCGVRR